MTSVAEMAGARKLQVLVERRCPYCRGQGHLYELPESRIYFAECDNCHAATPFGKTQAEVIGNWSYQVITRNRQEGVS